MKQAQHSGTPTRYQTTTTAFAVRSSNNIRMVREREPPRPSQTQPDQIPQVPRPSATQALKNLTNTTPSPLFGQASPLRNPLKKDDQLRQPNVSRPVAPKPSSNNIFMIPRAYPSSNVPDGRLSTGSNASLVEVPRPPTHQTMVYQSNPKPLFSSLNPPSMHNIQPTSSFYQPVNEYNYGLGLSRPTVDLTKDQDDFDPDEGLRNQDNFMDPDAYAYVDPLKAQESIKNLLEGAFDIDADKPRTRRRKKEQKDRATDSSLADSLNKLKVAEEKSAEQDEEEEDDGTVEGLKVKLLPHQIDGLDWLKDKEVGERKKKAVLPRGGILADDMGLGKTIQSLALLLSNPRPAKDAPEPEDERLRVPPKVGKGTLVVAPLALIKQWESEIQEKVEESHKMKVLVHHGPSRTKRFEELKKYDVVITTYNILTTEHAACSKDLKVGVFGVHWYRVILDEAHTIKNRNAKMTQACYNLRSHYRWCLTGTPMQNNLDELQSLIHFLDIKPYCELPQWRNHITQPMKNGRGNLAMRRLQLFLKAFMLRRTKDIMSREGAFGKASFAKDGKPPKTAPKMVKRDVESIEVDFDAEERRFYDRLATRAQDRLGEMIGGESTNYMAALVLLLRLRQACNHPELVATGASRDKDALTGNLTQNGTQTPSKAKAESGNADDLADLLGGLSVAAKKCDVCMAELPAHLSKFGAIRCEDCEGDLLDQLKSKRSEDKHRNRKRAESKPRRNRRVIDDSDDEEAEGEWVVSGDERDVKDLGKAGGTDDEDAEGGGRSIGYDDSDTDDDDGEDSFANNKTKKHINLVSSDIEEESPPRKKKQEILSSSKIRRLLQILDDETPNHKVIVFSQFTSMLDLIEPFLARAGHSFVRYDGSMRNDMREASLYSLRHDKRTRVLLCSLKCGSLGLNLTAASRVVILEPFWNPVSACVFNQSNYKAYTNTRNLVRRGTSNRPCASLEPDHRCEGLQANSLQHGRRADPRPAGC